MQNRSWRLFQTTSDHVQKTIQTLKKRRSRRSRREDREDREEKIKKRGKRTGDTEAGVAHLTSLLDDFLDRSIRVEHVFDLKVSVVDAGRIFDEGLCHQRQLVHRPGSCLLFGSRWGRRFLGRGNVHSLHFRQLFDHITSHHITSFVTFCLSLGKD